MRYYVLTTSAGTEIVRLRQGNAAYFEAKTGRWVSDPLLAVEVRSSGDWRQVEPEDLPDGILGVNEPPEAGKSRMLRRGRHSRR